MSNSGHGHVSPRDDGIKARCGGPALCRECAKDLALKTQQEKLMTSTDKERADFKEWRTELLDLIFHYATGAMLNGKTELKRHLARIERQIDAVPRAGREAERAEAVTDAEPIRAALEAAHKLLQPRLDEPDRTVFWLIVDALHDLKCCKTHPPKPEPSSDAWDETRLRKLAKERGWYIRENTSVPDIHSGGWRYPFSVTCESRELVELLNQPTPAALCKPEGK